MSYTHFRFIAYEVPTVTQGKRGGARSGFPPGEPCNAIKRIPVDPNTPEDAQIRLRRLAAVVDRAATSVENQLPSSPGTLKVFIAPEFYFRPPGDEIKNFNQTYTYDDAMKIFEELNKMFLHDDFKDWLIIAGTVMWNQTDEQGRLYRNAAPYIRGNEIESLRVVEKDVPSRIDGIPWPLAENPTEIYDPYIKNVFQDWIFRRNRVFSINGVLCGLEVCLDHGPTQESRVLKTVLSNWHINEPRVPVPDLSLHLLTAGGLPLQPFSVAAKTNGYILRNDGKSGPDYSELRRVKGYLRKSDNVAVLPSDLTGNADLTDPIHPDATELLAGNELVPMLGGTYKEFPQKLVYYPRNPLL
jgi:hypothetical protein